MRNKYLQSLLDLPPTGEGCHTGLLSCANYAVMGGIDIEQFIEDTRHHIDESNREVPDSEFIDAYETASMDLVPASSLPANYQPSNLVRKNVEPADCNLQILPKCSEENIKALSPELIPDEGLEQTKAYLQVNYSPGDMLFIGENNHKAKLGDNLKPTYGWVSETTFSPLIIPNPLSGEEGLTKMGQPSLRAQDCIKDFRYLVLEFDEATLEDQLAIIKFLVENGPVTSITFSGSKSYHCLLKIDARDHQHFDTTINRLRPYLLGIGADKACWHPDRLSRLPGALRPDKNNELQRLIYLNGNPEKTVTNLLKAFRKLAGEDKPTVILPGGKQSVSATGKKLGLLLAETEKYFIYGGLIVEVS